MASAARVAGVRATLDSGSVASRHVPPGATTLRAWNDSSACTLTPEKIQLSEVRIAGICWSGTSRMHDVVQASQTRAHPDLPSPDNEFPGRSQKNSTEPPSVSHPRLTRKWPILGGGHVCHTCAEFYVLGWNMARKTGQ